MRIVRFTDVADPKTSRTRYWGVLDGESVRELEASPFESGSIAILENGPLRSIGDVRLLAPVEPKKIICVGRNYVEHAAEFGNEPPSEPLIFLKPPTALVGPDQPVVYPSLSERLDHEGELAIVIGQMCRKIDEADALDVVFGYTIANDVTARDLQRKDGQWTRGKGFDTFAPVGPWIDTDFDPNDKDLRVTVNDEVRQQSNTSLLIHPVSKIIAHVAAFMTLEPGDIIMTGTPAGVGPVQPGDVMTVAIEGLGELSNPVVADD